MSIYRPYCLIFHMAYRIYYHFIKSTISLISSIRKGIIYAMGLGMIIWMAAPSQAASDDVSVLPLNAALIQALSHNQDLKMAENQVLSSEVSLARPLFVAAVE